MFGSGGFWGGFVGSDDHVTKERDPPPRPIDLEFPTYMPPSSTQPLTRRLSSRVRHKICHSRSFVDVTDQDLADLNINYNDGASLSSFVPENEFSSRPFLYDDDLQGMLDEISVENEDAFREVLRMQPLQGRKKPRLAYSRNFFGSLEDMARYWDVEKDEYFQVSTPGTHVDNQRSSKKDIISSDNPSDEDVQMSDAGSIAESTPMIESKEAYKGYRVSNAESMNPGARIAMTKNLLKMVIHKFSCRDHEPVPAPREKLVVRGVRIQSIQYHFCVAKIPSETKQARARLIEGPIMAVHIRDELRFKAKEGLLTPEKTGFVGERFDLLREIGCLLILAAQRARETKAINGTTDKWWISKPRWGGGPTRWGQLASEVFEEEDPSWSPEERKLQDEKRRKQEADTAKGIDEKLTAVDEKRIEVEDLLAEANKPAPAAMTPAVQTTTPSDLRPRKKKIRSMERPPGEDPELMRDGKRLMYTPPFRRKWYTEWQKLRPNTPTNDDKIIPLRIGKEQELSGFDDIYMVTSCNHHLSLVKMKVHSKYLEWLESGEPVDATEDHGLLQNVLYIQRSSWHDMFDVEQRKSFLLNLWRVMCWVNRKYIPEVEYEKMEERRKFQEMKNGKSDGDINVVVSGSKP